MRDNSKTKGDLAELKAATAFAELGYFVSIPLTDNAPYDLIVDTGEKLIKVQVKSRSIRKSVVMIENFTSSTNYSRAYEKGDFDLLVVYCIDNGRMAFLPWSEVEGGIVTTLRFDPPKNSQLKGVKFFSEYEKVILQ
jgi:hypothetical protein